MSLVYLSKPGMGPSVKKTKYTDITPDESYNKNAKGLVIKSFEEWAMLILQPPVERKLINAAKADSETRKRYNRCKKIIKHHYQFRFTQNDYAKKKKKPAKVSEPTSSQNMTTVIKLYMNFTC